MKMGTYKPTSRGQVACPLMRHIRVSGVQVKPYIITNLPFTPL